MNTVDVVVLLAYASLAVELLMFPIPSEASTLQLVTKGPPRNDLPFTPAPAVPGGVALPRAKLLLRLRPRAVPATPLAHPEPATNSRANPEAALGDDIDALTRAQRRSLAEKLVLFVLPTAIGIGLFVLPLACVFWPAARAALGSSPGGPMIGVGLAAILIGRVLTFCSVLQLRAHRRRGHGPAPGLFRWSRNPGLVGMFVFYLGLSFCYGLHWLWIGMPVYLVNMHHRVRLEEAHLLRRLGDDWRAYSRRVPRYVGRCGG